MEAGLYNWSHGVYVKYMRSVCFSGYDGQHVSFLFNCDPDDVFSKCLQCHHRQHVDQECVSI